MKLNTIVAAAVAAAFVLPTSLHAAEEKPSGAAADATFMDLDKNIDGSISREEAAGSAREKDFDKLDTNSDGKLSREEHRAAPAENASVGSGASDTSASPGGRRATTD